MEQLLRNKTANAGADAKRGLFGKKTKNGSPWDESVPEKDRLVNLMKAFEDLDINDFVRKYTNKSVEIKEPAEHEMQEIFASMNKTDAASQKMNCESCGYSSCRNMARAIYNGVNVKENCVHYVKSVVSASSVSGLAVAFDVGAGVFFTLGFLVAFTDFFFFTVSLHLYFFLPYFA